MHLYTVYLFLENCSTCFGWYLHPSSGAHITVFTVSGTSHGHITYVTDRYNRPMSSKLVLSLRSPHQSLIAPLLSPTRATFPAHLIILDLITRIISSEQYVPFRFLKVHF